MPTIALVANDRNLVTSVSLTLEAEGYRIAAYTDGASALSGFQTAPPDLAILDIKMPRLDGAEALRPLRAKSDLPKVTNKVLECGPLRMDLERHTCTWKNHRVRITASEFLILHALARHPGVVKSRNVLMEAVYDDQTYAAERNIDSHIKRLKFTASDSEFDVVETLYGCHTFSNCSDEVRDAIIWRARAQVSDQVGGAQRPHFLQLLIRFSVRRNRPHFQIDIRRPRTTKHSEHRGRANTQTILVQ